MMSGSIALETAADIFAEAGFTAARLRVVQRALLRLQMRSMVASDYNCFLWRTILMTDSL
jgi:hypothetical protein